MQLMRTLINFSWLRLKKMTSKIRAFASEISFFRFQKERPTKRVASQDGSNEPEAPISVPDIAPKGDASGRAVSSAFRAGTCSSLSFCLTAKQDH